MFAYVGFLSLSLDMYNHSASTITLLFCVVLFASRSRVLKQYSLISYLLQLNMSCFGSFASYLTCCEIVFWSSQLYFNLPFKPRAKIPLVFCLQPFLDFGFHQVKCSYESKMLILIRVDNSYILQDIVLSLTQCLIIIHYHFES